jgi:L-lactate dehydrogenase (cytochrome)
MIGRAYLYGLGAGGQPGAARAIEIIRNELDVSMALTGTRSVRDAGPHLIVGPISWPAAAASPLTRPAEL